MPRLMFLIREVLEEDLDPLYEVAHHLNTVNLPADRRVLADLIAKSLQSFAGKLAVSQRVYIFALVDVAKKTLIGTSMIQAQHGTRRAPHIFFDVLEAERYSESLDLHCKHKLLRIGYNYSGPTEIGGLILLPAYRKTPHRLGKLLSYVRFLFIGAHPDRFRDEVLSELMPPLEPDGTSLLWEHLGRHFTGMSYQEADRLSQNNKEFIRSLFPQDPLYVSLLPPAVQQQIGVVGEETKGVERMLRAVGFHYAKRIDPFDGGPHFIAKVGEITLIKLLARATLRAGEPPPEAPWGIVAVEPASAPHLLACGARYQLTHGEVLLPADVSAALSVEPGAELWIQPVP